MDEKSRRRSAPKASWGKRIGILLGVLIVLVVAGYFVLTSSAFIKGVILPQAGSALNAKITADSISVHPFSELHLQGLRVQTTGSEPLLTAQEIRVRYSLVDIVKGNINVDEITLASPVVQVIQEVDGSSNLDPLLKGQSSSSSEPSSSSGQPPKLSVENVSLKNGMVRQVQKLPGGGTKTTELRDANIVLDRLGNGQSGRLDLSAGLTLEQKSGGTNDLLAGNIAGGYEIALGPELLPQKIVGATKLTIGKAQGAYADLAGVSGSLDADLTPTELRRVALVFNRENQRLGEVRASGPLDLQRREGDLRIEVLSLDKHVLALAAAGKGMDFRQTEINSTNHVTLSQGGTFIAASGTLNGNNISMTQGEMTTPEMNLSLAYAATVNTTDKSAVLQKLNLDGTSGGRTFLRTELDRQMNLSWGETVKGYKDAALTVVVTNFNLADWRPVLGTNISAGMVQARLALAAQQDGKILKTDLGARIDGLTAAFGTNRIQGAGVSLDGNGTVEQMKTVNLNQFNLGLAQSGAVVLQASGSARYETESKNAKAQLTAAGDLPRLLGLAPMAGVTARQGKLELNANVSDSGGSRKAVGTVAINDFTGKYDSYSFEKFRANFEYNVEMDARKVDIRQAAASFSQDFHNGGSVDLKGQYDLEKKTGQFSFQTVDLNENTFRPVLGPSLGENQLVSISLNSSGEATLDPENETKIKATAKVSNWVVKDAAGTLPGTPLAAGLDIDAGMQGQALNLREIALKLSPTVRAKNEVRVQGKLDLAKTNATPSTVELRAESLDVTPYYEMFAGSTNATAKTQTPAQPAAANPPGSNEEPEPMDLPFKQLTASLNIGQLYLREMEISNWVGQVAIRSNVVQMRPFKMQLNGGAVSLTADVDTGVRGYRYDVGFQAGNVPLAPLANTFSAGLSNKLDGTFVADAKISGAGVTGASLQKTLGGNATFNLTNLNYEVVGPKLRRIIVPISAALRVPELAQTPINWASVQTQIGSGTVRIQHLGVQSEAFLAEGAGDVRLADVLTNSTLQIPLEISVRRSFAEKANIVPQNTPPDAKYAKLPQFVSVKGTVGAPDVDLNKLALAGILARSAAGLGLNFGNETAGQALNTVGNLLTGQSGGTNASGTNASPASGLIRGLGGLLGGGKDTNGPAGQTNAPATNAPASLNPFDLLKGFQKKE